MAADIDPTIAHLDFTPEPMVCECTGCRDDHGAQACARPATHCVSVHLFGECRNAALTVDGFASQLVCEPCMHARAATLNQLVFDSHRVYHRMGRFLFCSGCHTPVVRAGTFWKSRQL